MQYKRLLRNAYEIQILVDTDPNIMTEIPWAKTYHAFNLRHVELKLSACKTIDSSTWIFELQQ
jgi:hypothetical protein